MNLRPTLQQLLEGMADAPAMPIRGIASDSRQVEPGFVFLACQGLTSHGLDFLQQAIGQGAAAVVFDSDTHSLPSDVAIPSIAVPALHEKLGEIANRWFDAPSQALDVVGVTGTNGKTTVAWLAAQCRQQLGFASAYLGTLGAGVGEIAETTGMTTPAVVELHAQLADFVAADATHAAIEVSSHALSQRRVDGVRFKTAMFTNLTRDHLDYHADMQAYFDCKSMLFTVADPARRIVNIDSEYGARLAALCGPDVITVSTRLDRVPNGNPYVFVRSVVATEHGSEVTFVSSWGEGFFELPLPGDFNVANALLVLADLLADDIAMDEVCQILQGVTAPPGRMQRVGDSNVYVDYAHTPDAIDAALRALRPHTRGKLWCVFGCGGDRDRGKRPIMGKLAERRADHLILTSDNPRREAPLRIIDDIVAGIERDATVIEDRAAAIAWAIDKASDGDGVLIAGKGHENYQEVDGELRPFSDYAIASQALLAQGARL